LFGRPAINQERRARADWGCDAPDGLSDIAITPGAVFFLKSGLDRPKQGMLAVRLFQVLACARFQRTDSYLIISPARHDNNRQVASHPVKL
jgi:hypothetical protein